MKKRLALLACLATTAAFSAAANDGVELALKSKSMAAGLAPAQSAPLPAFAHVKDPLPEILLRQENERSYELRDGRIVYRAGREYMPRIEGLRPESISLRHDGFVLRYSFR